MAQCAPPRLLGDTASPACAPLCSPDRPFSCGLCTCANCSFCAVSPRHQAFATSSASVHNQERDAANQLLDVLQRRLKEPRGIAVRVLECSLPHCLGNMSFSVGNYGAPCIVHALAGKKSPVSVLRWDLPATIYHNGRCLEDSPHGGVVKGAGIGLILCSADGQGGGPSGPGGVDNAPYTLREDVAFAHDAWTPKHTEVRNNPWVAPIRLSLCSGRHQAQSPTRGQGTYAEARFQGTLHRMRTSDPRRQDGAYVNHFISSPWNCYWSRTSWEHAFEDQRAFANLLAERQDEAANGRQVHELEGVFGPGADTSQAWLSGKPGTWGATYNQVHASYGPADVCGVFYVNSTSHLTPRHQMLERAHFSLEVEARSSAAREAVKAYELAQLASRLTSSITMAPLPLPVLQLSVGDDSIDPSRVRKRVERGQAAADVREFFSLPTSGSPPVARPSTNLNTASTGKAAGGVDRSRAASSALSTFDRPPCADTPPELLASAWPSEMVAAATNPPSSCDDVLQRDLCKSDILLLCPQKCGRCPSAERASRIPREAFVFWGRKNGSTNSPSGPRPGRYSATNVARGAWLVCSMLGVLCHHHPGVYLKRPGEWGQEEDLKRCTNASELTMTKLRQGLGVQEAGVTIAYTSLMRKIVDRCHAPEKLGLSEPYCEPVLVFEDDAAIPADISPAQARKLMALALSGPGAVLSEGPAHTLADYAQVGWCSKACSHAFQVTVRGASNFLRHMETYPACMWGIPDNPSHPDHQEMWSVDDRLQYLCRKHVLRCTNGHHVQIDLKNTPDTETSGLIKQRKAISNARQLPARSEVPSDWAWPPSR